MKTLIYVLLSLALASAAFAGSRNYCKEEAVTYLKQKFGNGAEVLAFAVSKGNKHDIGWKLWARTHLCHGYFVFTYGAHKESSCTIARYNAPQLLYSVFGHGECKELLPRTEYPRLND